LFASQRLLKRRERDHIFCDQVPCWCKIGAGAQVYCEDEVKARGRYQAGKKEARGQQHVANAEDAVGVPNEPEAEEGPVVPDESGLRRVMAHSEQGKLRVTYDAAQAVELFWRG